MAELTGVTFTSRFDEVIPYYGLLRVIITNTTDTDIESPLYLSFDMPVEIVPISYQSMEVVNSGVSTTHVVGHVYEELTPIPPGKSINVVVRLDSSAEELSADTLPIAYTVETRESSDTTSPSPPSNVRVVASTPNSIAFAWDPATDDQGVISKYILNMYGDYPSGPEKAQNFTVIGSTGIVATGLLPLNNYLLWVWAFDEAGNISRASDSIGAWTTRETT